MVIANTISKGSSAIAAVGTHGVAHAAVRFLIVRHGVAAVHPAAAAATATVRREYGVIVGDRFSVTVSGKAASMDELKAALASINLSGLAALKNEGVQPG